MSCTEAPAPSSSTPVAQRRAAGAWQPRSSPSRLIRSSPARRVPRGRTGALRAFGTPTRVATLASRKAERVSLRPAFAEADGNADAESCHHVNVSDPALSHADEPEPEEPQNLGTELDLAHRLEAVMANARDLFESRFQRNLDSRSTAKLRGQFDQIRWDFGELATNSAHYYITRARFEEFCNDIFAAEAVFRDGFEAEADPIVLLRSNYDEFQQRQAPHHAIPSATSGGGTESYQQIASVILSNAQQLAQLTQQREMRSEAGHGRRSSAVSSDSWEQSSQTDTETDGTEIDSLTGTELGAGDQLDDQKRNSAEFDDILPNSLQQFVLQEKLHGGRVTKQYGYIESRLSDNVDADEKRFGQALQTGSVVKLSPCRVTPKQLQSKLGATIGVSPCRRSMRLAHTAGKQLEKAVHEQALEQADFVFIANKALSSNVVL